MLRSYSMPNIALSALSLLSHLIPATVSLGWCKDYSGLTDERTETESKPVTCLTIGSGR